MATIEIEGAPVHQRRNWLNGLRRYLHLHRRSRSRLRRRQKLQRLLASADARQQRDLGLVPPHQARFDWMLELARRN